MDFVDQEKKLDMMIKNVLMSKDKKEKHEFKKWEEKAKGKHRQHQF